MQYLQMVALFEIIQIGVPVSGQLDNPVCRVILIFSRLFISCFEMLISGKSFS